MDVLMSIRPYWAEKILSGEKTAEIRRTYPAANEPPFTVYLYATHPVQAVIGQFTCTGVKELSNQSFNEPMYHFPHNGDTCLTRGEMERYGKGRALYRTPKPLTKFWCRGPLFHPPQSWLYVEKIKKTCRYCHYLSDDFTSACVNGDSKRRADFVQKDDTCPLWQLKGATKP